MDMVYGIWFMDMVYGCQLASAGKWKPYLQHQLKWMGKIYHYHLMLSK